MPWTYVLLTLTVMSWIYWLVASLCVAAFYAEPQPGSPADPPPASILRPMHGPDEGAYENLKSFLNQDYPSYEILCGVTDPLDPALGQVRRLQREFPRARVRAYVAPRCGANDKAAILCHLAEKARFDILVACDSDMRVTPDYLRRMVAPLADRHVGLVTCLYRGSEARSLTARLESLYITTAFLPSVLVARRYLNMSFALGASVALSRAQLREIGGFQALADYLADDYQLGARVAATGHRVHLSDYATEGVLGATTFHQQWGREVRWAKCTRVSRPLEYPGLLLTFSTPLALLTAASLHFASLGWAILGASLAVRWLVAWQMGRRLGDPVIRTAWPWLPLRDLLTAIVWCAAGLGRRVSWRDRSYLLRPGGRLEEIVPREAPEATP